MDAVAPCFRVGLNIALARSSRLERLALKSCRHVVPSITRVTRPGKGLMTVFLYRVMRVP